MRKGLAGTVVAALTVVALTGCSGPNPDAVEAAADYSTELADWADALAAADDDLGAVLEDVPALTVFDDVEDTPTYLAARDVAEQVDAIAIELAALEAAALDELDGLAQEAYWVVADLYYGTLGAASDRLNALSDSWELEDEDVKRDAQAAAHREFATARATLLERAAEELSALAPEDGLGVSITAFATGWYLEEVEFQQSAVSEIESWRVFTSGYKDFWGFGNLNEVYGAPEEYAAELRTAFVQQIEDLAAGLSQTTRASSDPSSPPTLPALGDPYRQLLLEGYRPWDDAEADQLYAATRLWLLWRIRELENTPADVYGTARTTLLEELNRNVEEDSAVDHRPGTARLLGLIQAYSDEFGSLFGAVDERWLDGLADVHSYGTALRGYPMTADVAEAYDEVLGLYEQLNRELRDVAEASDDERDAERAVRALGDEYQEKVLDAASPALAALDDDARFAQALTEAITATRPSR